MKTLLPHQNKAILFYGKEISLKRLFELMINKIVMREKYFVSNMLIKKLLCLLVRIVEYVFGIYKI